MRSVRPSRRQLLLGGSAAVAAAAVAPRTIAQAAAAASGTCESRYLHYRPVDEAKPYAKYMKPHTDPPQANVPAAITRGPVDPRLIPKRTNLPAELGDPGYADIETGYGKLPNGEIWVACLTDMPRVTPAMWDWWFGWHSKESARYKLWHPDAHGYAALRVDRADKPGLTDTQRYVGNTSYVDEIIGGHLDQLAIRFVPPASRGLDPSAWDGTAICGVVGSAFLPFDIGVLCHQVRPTATGSEMRSRFYLNVLGVKTVDGTALGCALKRGLATPGAIPFDLRFGAALLRHCGEEMNHLAQFLPELHAEFS